MDISKFRCSACGKCCSKIQGLISEEEKKFIEEFGYGKLPLIQLTPVSEMTFPLWDFEAKRFRQYEKKTGTNANIIPSRGVMDLNSNKFIVFTYHMNSEACPFLFDDGKCSIYNTSRAFICHLFPFNRSPFLDTGAKDKEFFGTCPNLANIIDKLDHTDQKKLINQLYDSFGDTFLAAIQHDLVIEWSNRLLMELIKEKKIRPTINYPYDKLLKRIENSKKVDLTEFLLESGYKTREEVDELIRRFEGLQDAKEKIMPYIVN